MIKIITFIFCFIILSSMSMFASAATSSKEPLLVLDMRNAPELPRNFRTTSDNLPSNYNARGLSALKIAGGSQFSKRSFEKILQRLQAKNIVVIDLRQESHGMLDSNAVSWYGWRNSANSNLTPDEIEKTQSSLLEGLDQEEIAEVKMIVSRTKTGQIEKMKSVEYALHQVAPEEEFVTERGSLYRRIYVQDYHAPSPVEVDRFLEIIKSLPKDKWIYFHCRAGKGRTTTFMLMYDMLKNAKTVSLKDMLARQINLGGKDLSKLPENIHFKYKAALERWQFIQKFYQYAHDNKDNFVTLWSQWINKKIVNSEA